jgi:hypothetical protein
MELTINQEKTKSMEVISNKNKWVYYDNSKMEKVRFSISWVHTHLWHY